MNQRLRLMLAAFSDAQAYKGYLRFPWTVIVASLIVVVGLAVGATYTLWFYWSTLLFTDAFGSNGYSLWGTIWPVLVFMRIPLDISRLEGMFSAEPFALALAVRRALAAGDATIAPTVVAPAEGGEPSAFASAPLGTESLVVAVPELLIVSRANSISMYCLSALLLCLAGGGAALAPVMFNLPFQQLVTSTAGAIYLAGVCGAPTLFALWFLALGRRKSRLRLLQRHGMTVALDDLGLSFCQPVGTKRQRQLTWADVRALGRLTYKDKYTREHTVYILASDEQSLVWEEPPTERYALPRDRQFTVTLQESSRSLVTAITRRTRLPIRDVSGAITTVTSASSSSSASVFSFLSDAYDAALAESDVETATALWRLRQPRARRQPRALQKLAASASAPSALLAHDTLASSTTNALTPRLSHFAARMGAMIAPLQEKRQQLLQVARALIPYYPTEDAPTTPVSFRRHLRRERVRRSLTWQIVWAQGLMIVALLAGSGVYWYSERDMTSLAHTTPQQTEALPPVYFASLARPQSDWTVQKASKDDPTAAAFAHGAYQVSCVDPNASATFSIPQYDAGDMAIGVTVAIHGPASQDNYSSAGILFDATDNGDEFSSFGVDEQGNWNLTHYSAASDANYPWNTIDSNSSQAIHTGDNATNRLLLVRHGPFYLLYVNGALVDRYYDSDHTLRPGGGIGVYIDACNIVASFDDFTVYPIPSQLAAVPAPPDLPSWFTNWSGI